MGSAISSCNGGSFAASSTSPGLQAVLEVARTINNPLLAQFVITTQLSFLLNASELAVLFPMAVGTSIELAFALFDPTSKGVVDSCELLASLVLVAPQLSREAKQKAIFQLFNVSTHRVGLLVADEATLLFRTVAVGAAKVFGSAGPTAKEFPQLAYFENLTKTLYGEVETLSYEDFAHKCQVTADIDAFMAQWTHASHIA